MFYFILFSKLNTTDRAHGNRQSSCAGLLHNLENTMEYCVSISNNSKVLRRCDSGFPSLLKPVDYIGK